MEYVPLRISTVGANSELTFDLYIFFKDQYLCYVPKGKSIDEEKLEKLIHQSITDFYIPKDQIDNVNVYLDQAIQMALCKEGISSEESIDLMEGVASTAVEQMQSEPNEKSYSMTQKAAKGLRELMTQNPSALKILFGKKSKEADQIINHCINVCTLATKLAEHIKLPSDEIDELATAALIHDIGLPHLKRETLELFSKDREEMKNEERFEYFKHTKISSQLLSSKPFISKQVEELIEFHEENLQGTGPFKKTKLTPLQECLNLVNTYDKRVFTKKETPAEAFKAFQIDYIGMFNLELIKRFELVLKEEGLL